MDTVNILKVIAAGILLFLLWNLIKKYVHVPGIGIKENLAPLAPAAAPLEIDVPPVEGPRNISPSGPNPPNQNMAIRKVVDEEKPNDPYYEETESAHAPENLRHPEGMFRPAPEMGETNYAVNSGVASHIINANNNALQQFNPEFAQNGGSFMGNIMPHDGEMNVGYSMF